MGPPLEFFLVFLLVRPIKLFLRLIWVLFNQKTQFYKINVCSPTAILAIRFFFLVIKFLIHFLNRRSLITQSLFVLPKNQTLPANAI